MTSLLEIECFSFRYADSTGWAVKDFDLKADEGEVIVLAGPSGCGKSTLLRAVNGLIPHMYSGEYSGSVKVEGKDAASTQMKELAQMVGFLFQNPENQIFMFSVERDVAFGLENLGVGREEMKKRVEEALRLMSVSDLARRAPHELSDGQKQRVALAGVLAMRPKLIILDEPTSLLDPMTASELVSTVDRIRRETSASFFVVEHRLDLLVRIADRLVVMNKGRKVMDGKPSDVLAHPDAGGYGVAVPAITRLENAMIREGVVIPGNLLSPHELASEVNARSP